MIAAQNSWWFIRQWALCSDSTIEDKSQKWLSRCSC